jgi:hypothetical protein
MISLKEEDSEVKKKNKRYQQEISSMSRKIVKQLPMPIQLYKYQKLLLLSKN